MATNVSLMAIFPDLEPAADAIEQLRTLGIADDQMNVISGVPVTEAMLGRPRQWTNVPRLALGGAVAGFFVGALLAFGTPSAYPIQVGRQAVIPVPPSIVVIFEMTMLGLLLATFLGVFLDSYFPSYRPMHYVPEISNGKIGVFFSCSQEDSEKITRAMTALGAEKVEAAEAQSL
jgi:hypothetical protein